MMKNRAWFIPFDRASAIILPGNLEIIPIMMSIEIPLPIPLSVIFSPSHIQNIVPDVNIIILDIVNKHLFSTRIASLGIVPDRYAVLWNIQIIIVRYLVI